MLPDHSTVWYSQISEGYRKLAEMRSRDLRDMTESESARIFSLLDPPRPYELRPSSGLLEQQRLFRKFWERNGESD